MTATKDGLGLDSFGREAPIHGQIRVDDTLNKALEIARRKQVSINQLSQSKQQKQTFEKNYGNNRFGFNYYPRPYPMPVSCSPPLQQQMHPLQREFLNNSVKYNPALNNP